MSITTQHSSKRVPHSNRSPRRRSDGGFAVLIVFILLAIIVALAIGNNVALAHLQSELRLAERRQLQRHGSAGDANVSGSKPLGPAARQTSSPASATSAAPAP